MFEQKAKSEYVFLNKTKIKNAPVFLQKLTQQAFKKLSYFHKEKGIVGRIHGSKAPLSSSTIPHVKLPSKSQKGCRYLSRKKT